MLMSESNQGMKKVSYLCASCGQTINFGMDEKVHLQRQELKISGLASYIDVHEDKNGRSHGLKLFVDPNFHVRTNHKLELNEEKSSSPIPMPGFKTKNLTTNYPWKTWVKLELELKKENLKFFLELGKDAHDREHMVNSEIKTVSSLGLIESKIDAIVHENATISFQYISQWMQSLCNSLELAASIHVDLIPEVLRYIDTHSYREISHLDRVIIAILIDRASILIPNKDTIKMLKKYGPGLDLIGLNSHQFTKIATKLSEFDQFTMRDIQDILKEEIDDDAELEEEIIILALFYLLSMNAFDYKLSYLHKEFEN